MNKTNISTKTIKHPRTLKNTLVFSLLFLGDFFYDSSLSLASLVSPRNVEAPQKKCPPTTTQRTMGNFEIIIVQK